MGEVMLTCDKCKAEESFTTGTFSPTFQERVLAAGWKPNNITELSMSKCGLCPACSDTKGKPMNRSEQSNALLEAKWIIDGKTIKLPAMSHLQAYELILQEKESEIKHLSKMISDLRTELDIQRNINKELQGEVGE